jgi:hypothetical protein
MTAGILDRWGTIQFMMHYQGLRKRTWANVTEFKPEELKTTAGG